MAPRFIKLDQDFWRDYRFSYVAKELSSLPGFPRKHQTHDAICMAYLKVLSTVHKVYFESGEPCVTLPIDHLSTILGVPKKGLISLLVSMANSGLIVLELPPIEGPEKHPGFRVSETEVVCDFDQIKHYTTLTQHYRTLQTKIRIVKLLKRNKFIVPFDDRVRVREKSKREKEKEKEKPPAAPGASRSSAKGYSEVFENFWQSWGRHGSKAEAFAAWKKLGSGVTACAAENGLIRSAAIHNTFRQSRYTAHGNTPPYPQKWLNGQRWEMGEYADEVYKQGFILELYREVSPNSPSVDAQSWVNGKAYWRLHQILCKHAEAREAEHWRSLFQRTARDKFYSLLKLDQLIDKYYEITVEVSSRG